MSSQSYHDHVSLNPVYLSARSAIITPERAIPVTIYSLRKWLPRLGPERWGLVQLLRGLCFDADRRADGTKRVTTSWKLLGALLQVHEETIASWLKHKPIPEDKPWRRIMPTDDYSEYLSLFIPRLRYAYETRQGKTRRVGFLLEVLMEDPIAPEDEVKLTHQLDLLRYEQGRLALENRDFESTLNPIEDDLPLLLNTSINNVTLSDVDLPAQRQSEQQRLTQDLVNPNKFDLPTHVKQPYVDLENSVTTDSSNLPNSKSKKIRENVNKLQSLIEKLQQLKHQKRNYLQIFEPIVVLTENLLDDHHSTAMFYKVLRVLFPDYMHLYLLAVEEALEAHSIEESLNKGAVFVNSLRQLSIEANIDLGFKPPDIALTPQTEFQESLIPSPRQEGVSALSTSVEEALWSETLSKLQGQMLKKTFTSVMQGTKLIGLEDDLYIVQVSTPLAKDWLENRLRSLVERALASVIGTSVPIKVEFRL